MPAKHAASSPLEVKAVPITSSAFSQFGSLIANPAHATTPSTSPIAHEPYNVASEAQQYNGVLANQGTAVKYKDVTDVQNYYHSAPSRKSATIVMNMFVCAPRALSYSASADIEGTFPVRILERHPFTSQTFIPVGVSPSSTAHTRYLVVVAPTLPVAATRKGDRPVRPPPFPTREPQRRRSLREVLSGARPPPFPEHPAGNTVKANAEKHQPQSEKALPGPGMPDLANLKAFIVSGDQAVTYAAGTWHAPMVVLGDEKIDFVVLQWANGVGNEDCQECEIQGEFVGVDIPVAGKITENEGWKEKSKL
jgi:ureidoglycolate lyase